MERGITKYDTENSYNFAPGRRVLQLAIMPSEVVHPVPVLRKGRTPHLQEAIEYNGIARCNCVVRNVRQELISLDLVPSCCSCLQTKGRTTTLENYGEFTTNCMT